MIISYRLDRHHNVSASIWDDVLGLIHAIAYVGQRERLVDTIGPLEQRGHGRAVDALSAVLQGRRKRRSVPNVIERGILTDVE